MKALYSLKGITVIFCQDSFLHDFCATVSELQSSARKTVANEWHSLWILHLDIFLPHYLYIRPTERSQEPVYFFLPLFPFFQLFTDPGNRLMYPSASFMLAGLQATPFPHFFFSLAFRIQILWLLGISLGTDMRSYRAEDILLFLVLS